MHRVRLIAPVVLVSSLAFAPAQADDFDDCVQDFDLDLSLSACTAIIESGAWPDPDVATAHYIRAIHHDDRGERGRAIEDYQQAIRLDPEFAEPYNDLAWALYLDGRAADALPLTDTAMMLLPEAVLLDTRAHIYAALGQIEEAVTEFERAMAMGGIDQVQDYQRALAEHGHYRGSDHGFYDAATRAALYACLQAGCRLLE